MRFKATAHQAFGVGTPLAEIVVDVNGGDTGAPAAVFELGQSCRHWQGIFQDLVAIREFEMVDDVDQDESDRGFVAGAVISSHGDPLCLAQLWQGGMAEVRHDGRTWPLDRDGGFRFFSRFSTSFIVNALADSSPFSSSHARGTATGAPGRARTP